MLSFLLITGGSLILLYLALIFESTAFALLGFSLMALAVLSFVLLLIVKRSISARVDIPIGVTEKNGRISFNITVFSSLPFYAGRLRFFIDYGSTASEKRSSISLNADGVIKGKRTFTYHISINHSGNYEFRLKKLRVYDPTGIFHLTKRTDCSASAMVMPEIFDIPVSLGESVKNFFGEAVDFDDMKPGSAPDEVFGVREFRDGDKIQRIHWKLTARMDELMVKESSFPRSCPIILLLDGGSSGIEGVPEWAASISFSLMDNKCPHYAVFYSKSRKDLVRIRVEDEEGYYLFISSYLQDDGRAEPGDILERYKEKYRREVYLHMIRPISADRVLVDDEELEAKEITQLTLLLR